MEDNDFSSESDKLINICYWDWEWLWDWFWISRVTFWSDFSVIYNEPLVKPNPSRQSDLGALKNGIIKNHQQILQCKAVNADDIILKEIPVTDNPHLTP